MPLQIVRNDITKIECDAIVNAANSSLLGGGGVDGAIHKAAGKELLLECMTLHGCCVGEAKITKGYNLPAKYVIHTVGPQYKDGKSGEKELLSQCYKNSLNLAKENNCKSVAFPLISSGVYGYPKDQALKTAVDAITDFLLMTKNDMIIYIVVFDKSSFQIGEKLFSDISSYIDDKYAETHFISEYANACEESERLNLDTLICENETFNLDEKDFLAPNQAEILGKKKILASKNSKADVSCKPKEKLSAGQSLDDALNSIDESFSQMLLRKIDEKGLNDSQVYKKANIDRKLFSKIRSNIQYKPSKTTAIAFAVALELPLDETKDMLQKAGYALSHSNKFDIIIEYFIINKNYNIFEINEALFAFDQSLLGSF